MNPQSTNPDPRSKNFSLALNLAAVAAGMLMLAYASVPLYRLFCEMTGYGGTTRVAASAPSKMGTRQFTIRFNADTDPGLPWEFAPGEHEHSVRSGEQMLTYYVAKNLTQSPISGHATYNVLPFEAGQYFTKIDCFCFKEQTLAPGQKVHMPVVFYVDPAIENDPDLAKVKTITLSYTFFKTDK